MKVRPTYLFWLVTSRASVVYENSMVCRGVRVCVYGGVQKCCQCGSVVYFN